MALFSCESSRKEGADKFPRQFLSDHAPAHHQNIHIIVFDALVRGICVVAKAGADAGNLIGRHRRPHPAAADEYAPVGAPFDHSQTHGFGKVGIIDGILAVGAYVENLVAQVAHKMGQILLQIKSCVVGTENNLHEEFLRGDYWPCGARLPRAAISAFTAAPIIPVSRSVAITSNWEP